MVGISVWGHGGGGVGFATKLAHQGWSVIRVHFVWVLLIVRVVGKRGQG